MLHEFATVNELISAVREDGKRITRFPVRFILLSGLNAWSEVLASLNLEVDDTIKISSFCKQDDLFPTLSVSNITMHIQKCIASKTLITPLAECLRFSTGEMHEHFSNILRELAQWELPGRKRIYIPIFEYTDSFNKEMDRIPRAAAGEIPDVWVYKGHGDIVVQAVPFEIPTGEFERVKGFKAFLNVWEKGGISRIQVITQIAPYTRKYAGNYEIQVYRDGYEVVREQVRDFPAVNKELGTEEHWRWLAMQLDARDDFNRIASRLLNIRAFDETQLLSLWETFKEQEKWLLWLWARAHKSTTKCYLAIAAKKAKTHGQVIESIFNTVFALHDDLEMLRTRKTMLVNLRVTTPPGSFWLAIGETKDPLVRLRCLSGITHRERQEIVLCVKELLSQGVEPEVWWPVLEICYPELALYLREPIWENGFLKEYFSTYILSRVLDCPKANLAMLAEEFLQQGIIWSIPTRESVLEKTIKVDIPSLWVDGMGLEWAGLLSGLIRGQASVQLQIDVVRANLPTTTAYNKGWDNETQIIRGLDQIAHSYDYCFPRSFVDEIEIINKVAETALGLLEEADSVVITGDHGLSRSSFHQERVLAVPIGATVHHWGRFAQMEGFLPPCDSKEHAIIRDGDKAVLAVHGRFDGASRAVGEIHGGATPEEWLVPIIRISKSEPISTTMFDSLVFRLLDQVIKLDIKGKGHLRVQLSGQPRQLRLTVGAKSFPATRVKTDYWDIPIEGLKSGVYKGRLEWEGGFLGELTFQIMKGIKGEDLGL